MSSVIVLTSDPIEDQPINKRRKNDEHMIVCVGGGDVCLFVCLV